MDKLETILPVILCGGSGTRLWPVSRQDYPKQFHPLVGDFSLLQTTVQRINDIFATPPLLITSEAVKFIVAHQLQQIDITGTILAEPVQRNSGPAILLASFYALDNYKDYTIAVFASDHVIDGIENFYQTVEEANEAAKHGYITTFGISPTTPAEAYGYIQADKKIEGIGASSVKAFIEKPDQEKAQDYLKKGYLWNSGNFIFMPDLLIEEYKRQDSQTVHSVQNSLEMKRMDLGIISPNKEYEKAKDLSIDYAVMERTQKAAVVKASFSWSDAGTWESLYALSPKDSFDNASFGKNIFLNQTKECYIHNASDKLISVSDLQDIALIVTDDVIFASKVHNSGSIKAVLHRLKKNHRAEAVTPNRVHRPWGCYETITNGNGYQVKRISVYPSGTLSLQKHFHRAEHWVVVSGTAEVTNGNETYILQANQSTYIPKERIHRLKNIGEVTLELIEVQSGDYLGEDDIVRLEDVYNRE